ncbi:MAG: hypothetical protein ACOCXM_02665 [Myxococcota bacterium]
MGEKYPLEPVQSLRHAEVEAAEQDLAQFQTALSEARARLEQAVRALEHHREGSDAAERRAPSSSGPHTGQDLIQHGEHTEQRRERDNALDREVDHAREAVRAAEKAAERARAALGEAHTREKVVDRHREKWEHAQPPAGEHEEP